ncbi:NADAR family protein [Aquirhabdus parva]|uniref:NADAR family protein n=1 Tax=Aquirhabdus parva TaxID=2283318 RepID=UPI001D193246|nr:NADAR family protein [Aquirhabdus parva]
MNSVRSKDALIEIINRGEQPKYIFFWGHQKSKAESVTKTCFSQWYEASFDVESDHYLTAEHFMMAKKAELFGDIEIKNKILKAKDPGKAKALGRLVDGFDHEVWLKHRWDIVVQANIHKFQQNLRLKEYLLSTQSRVLVEASPVDQIWGIGLDAASPFAELPEKWQGLNLLGFALMEVRSLVSE